MKTDEELKIQGFKALEESLGSVEAERFIALILREPFDYTQWRQELFQGKDVAELSEAAAKYRAEKDNINP